MKPRHLYMALMYGSEAIAGFSLFKMWFQSSLIDVFKYGFTAFMAIAISLFFYYLVYLEARGG